MFNYWFVAYWQSHKICKKAYDEKRSRRVASAIYREYHQYRAQNTSCYKCATMLGIATTSFVAVLGAAGLAIGLALQGSLANFAGGVLILLFRPFKVGDLIEADGEIGVVQSITVLHTILTTPADNTAILPNGNVASNKILNYTKENQRRVDLTVGIAYHEDVNQAKKVIKEALQKIDRVAETPEPFVGILNFGDSSVNLAVRPYCNSADYWDVYFAANDAIKQALDNANIEIPFPQRVVEIKK